MNLIQSQNCNEKEIEGVVHYENLSCMGRHSSGATSSQYRETTRVQGVLGRTEREGVPEE
jgi:hypothetical protein